MARTGTPLGGPMANGLTIESDVENTAEEDVRLGPTTLLHLQADNTVSASTKSYVKLFDANVVVPGTTKPDIILPVPAVGTDPAAGLLEMWTSLLFGVGLSYFASKLPGNEAADSPAQNLVLRLVTSS